MNESDFWEGMESDDKEAVLKGISQLERGESLSFEDAEIEIQNRFNFLASNVN